MPSPDRSLTAIAGLVAIVLIGCTAAAPQSTSAPQPPASSAPAASSAAQPAASSPPAASIAASPAPPRASTPAADPSSTAGSTSATADSWLVVGRAGAAGTRVILASTGEVLYDLPDG